MRAIIAAFMVLTAAAASAASLCIGDKAPALKGAVWVKNGPVALKDGFGKKVYLVEFWATWCPPCRMSIPHLSDMQKKYASKGLVVVGISDEPFEKVKKFVESQKKMDYNVAVSGDSGVYQAYMSGERGIPTAFLIGKDGKVVWKGHPLNSDSVVEKLLSGDFNPAAQKKIADLNNEMNNALQGRDMEKASEIAMRLLDVDPENQTAMQIVLYGFRGDMKKTLEFLSSLIASHPAAAAPYINKIKILSVQKDVAGLRETARLYFDNFKNDPSKLNTLSWILLDSVPFGVQPLDMALEMADRAVALSAKGGDDTMRSAYLDTLARAQYALGRLDLAIKTQAKAVKLMVGEKERSSLTRTFDFYKKAKALGEKLK